MNIDAPRVSVIVPNYRGFEQLSLCLAALHRQTFPHDQYEIIVADNNSPEGEAAVAAVVGDRARVVTVLEKGAGSARNGGVAAARGEFLAFTDSDCIPDPHWLAEGMKALGHYDLVGGRMVVLVDDADRMTAAEGFETIFAFNNERYVREVGFTVTANLFCSRRVFDSVGGFMTIPVSEDLEWCRRAARKGFRLGYADSSVVGHPARTTWDALLQKWRRINNESFGTACLVGGDGRWRWTLRSILAPATALAHTPRVIFDKRLNSPRLRLEVLLTLYRLRWWRFMNALELAFRSSTLHSRS